MRQEMASTDMRVSTHTTPSLINLTHRDSGE